jgi:mannose-6-phosphate isomerase-like protein (cupin superfamily)
MPLSKQLGEFLQAAAGAYRKSGHPDAVRVASWLDEHAQRGVKVAPAGPPPIATPHLKTVADSAGRHAAIRPIADDLARFDWTVGDLAVPAGLSDHFAFVTFVGDDTPNLDPRLFFGLFLIAPDTHYPLHWHLAEELYFVLSGAAHWEQGDGIFRPKSPGTLIHHRPNEPHAMATGEEPLLAMWSWYGDLRPDTYRVDATRGAKPPVTVR